MKHPSPYLKKPRVNKLINSQVFKLRYYKGMYKASEVGIQFILTIHLQTLFIFVWGQAGAKNILGGLILYQYNYVDILNHTL